MSTGKRRYTLGELKEHLSEKQIRVLEEREILTLSPVTGKATIARDGVDFKSERVSLMGYNLKVIFR